MNTHLLNQKNRTIRDLEITNKNLSNRNEFLESELKILQGDVKTLLACKDVADQYKKMCMLMAKNTEELIKNPFIVKRGDKND